MAERGTDGFRNVVCQRPSGRATEGVTAAAAAAVGAMRKGHTAKVILIPLRCAAHSHDSRAVLNVRSVDRGKIEKRNRYRYKNGFFPPLVILTAVDGRRSYPK